jgi:hypothetical protein
MNGQQRAVLWIGLILVGLNLVGHWAEIKSVIFTGADITTGFTSGTTNTAAPTLLTTPATRKTKSTMIV